MDCAAKKCIQSKFTVATKIRQGGFDTAFNSFEVSEKKRQVQQILFQRLCLMYLYYRHSYLGPFILQPLFQKSVEKWFQKSGSSNSDFFSGQPLFSNQNSRTRFLEPLFSNHFSTTFQKSGCRINGPLRRFFSEIRMYVHIYLFLRFRE